MLMKNARTAVILLLLSSPAAAEHALAEEEGTPGASVVDLDAVSADALSGDPARIERAIEIYSRLDVTDTEVAWRLARAWFNLYDELAERNRRDDQRRAAETGYALASEALKKAPRHPGLVYYHALLGLCYLDFHRLKALFIVSDIIDGFKLARELDPRMDDAGPDRNLGLLYHQLPGWPLSVGDDEKALLHLREAARLAPLRAANRLPLAKALADEGEYDEGWKHVAFVRAGEFLVSSPHWRDIYLRRAEEVAREYPERFHEK